MNKKKESFARIEKLSKKRIISLLMSLLMVICTFTSLNPFFTVKTYAYALSCKDNVFSDVPNKAWFKDSALFCYNFGYMSGTGDAAFSPNVNVSRAMIACTIYNLDNSAETYSTSPFTDVAVGAWYHNACTWANEKGIATGTGGNMYAPNSDVTREQLALFLMKYAETTGIDTTGRADLSKYTDKTSISSWAKNAVEWAVYAGLISGTTDTTISPKESANRAALSTMLLKFETGFHHDYVINAVRTQRTCTADGNVIYKCTKCGIERSVSLKSWHTFDEGKITKQPTETSEGVKSRTCSVCGKVETTAIPKIIPCKHVLNAGVITKAPTCTEKGVLTKVCQKCGKWFPEDITALGHQLNSGVITKAPTCTQKGTLTKVCQRCGKWFPQDVSALGHQLNSGVVTKAATCTQNGTLTKVCQRCGEWFPQSISALGHNWSSRVTTAPTCQRTGVRTYTCTRCYTTKTESIPTVGHTFDASGKCIVCGASMNDCKIVLKTSLPKTLSDYYYNGKLNKQVSVTEFRYVCDYSSYSNDCDVDFYFSGQKTYDSNPSTSSYCPIGWKLYDGNGYVVDSGTCYSSSIFVGERFRDAKDWVYNLRPGQTYYLELINTK